MHLYLNSKKITEGRPSFKTLMSSHDERGTRNSLIKTQYAAYSFLKPLESGWVSPILSAYGKIFVVYLDRDLIGVTFYFTLPLCQGVEGWA